MRNRSNFTGTGIVATFLVIPFVLLAGWVGSIVAGVQLAPASATETSSSRTVQVPGDARVPAYVRTPCEFEDSVNCYWNAATRGNGLGHSYYAIRVGRSGVLVRYWNRSYGKTHDRYLPDGW